MVPPKEKFGDNEPQKKLKLNFKTNVYQFN
jgi:hypothetical protein